MTDQTAQVLTTTPSSAEPTPASLVEALVGPDKKFKTVEDLAKGKAESDAFIERIKAENAQMRKDMEALAASRELQDELEAAHQAAQHRGKPAVVAPSSDDLAEIVRKEINNTRQEETAKANVLEADRFLTEYFGGSKEKATQFITEKAEAMGMSLAWLVDVASRSPKALYTVLGVDPAKQPQPGTRQSPSHQNTVNTDAKDFAPNGSNVKPGTKAYYDALRKSNPAQYWSAKVQNEIHAKAVEGVYFQ